MGEVKRRNRGLTHRAQPHADAEQSVVFFEQLIQQEVRKALRQSQTKHRRRHATS